MKKSIYLGGILIIMLFTTGCSLTEKAAKKTAEKAVEAAVESSTNAEVDIKEGSITITDEETGTTTQLGEDVSLPDNFPSDVPIFEDVTVIASLETAEGEFTTTMTSTEDHGVITKFYETELKKEGWTIDNTATITIQGKSTTFLASKNGRELSVGIYNVDEETMENSISIQVN